MKKFELVRPHDHMLISAYYNKPFRLVEIIETVCSFLIHQILNTKIFRNTFYAFRFKYFDSAILLEIICDTSIREKPTGVTYKLQRIRTSV